MRSEDIKTGWRIVTGILGVLLLLGAIGQILNLMVGMAGGRFDLLSFGRFAIEIWLCWNVYQGKDWARLVLGVLLLWAALQMVLTGMSILVGLGIITLIFAVSLFVIPQVNAYFAYAKHQ